MLLPFYWNIAPNYDWEIAPRFMVKRGVAFNNHLPAICNRPGPAKSAPNDSARRSCHRYQPLHRPARNRQVFSAQTGGTLQLQKASDDQYFTDLATASAPSLVNLPRIGTLTWAEKDWNLPGASSVTRPCRTRWRR